MLTHPRAILLDLDGTLAGSLDVMRGAYRNFLRSFRVAPSDSEFDSLNGPPLLEVVRILKATHQLKPDEESLFSQYSTLVDQSYRSAALLPGARELLEIAKANGCRVGIVTSNSTARTLSWLAEVQIEYFIDFVVSGDDVLQSKPHPEPYRLACAKAGCDVAHIAAAEDSAQGLQSIVAAGIPNYFLVSPALSLNDIARTLWPSK